MTTTDKTGEMLAASVRRTKENVAQDAAPATPATPAKKAPVKRTTAAASTAAKPAAKPPARTRAKAAATPSAAADRYQGGRRIWPD